MSINGHQLATLCRAKCASETNWRPLTRPSQSQSLARRSVCAPNSAYCCPKLLRRPQQQSRQTIGTAARPNAPPPYKQPGQDRALSWRRGPEWRVALVWADEKKLSRSENWPVSRRRETARREATWRPLCLGALRRTGNGPVAQIGRIGGAH